MDNVITCPSCRTEYDGSKVEPGARFACVSCGGIVSVSINHNPAAHQPATVADVATAATPELIRGAGSTFVAEPTRTAPPMAANAGKASPTWYGGWEINKRSPKVRGFGFPIAMTVSGYVLSCLLQHQFQGTEFGGLFGLLAFAYPLYWFYSIHAEHPRRTGIDYNPLRALAVIALPSVGAVVMQIMAVAANDGLGAAPATFEPLLNSAGEPFAPVQHQYAMANLFNFENYSTGPGIAALGLALVALFAQYRVYSRLTGRLNALRDSLPDGPFARPKRVNEKLVKLAAGAPLVFAGGLVGAQATLIPDVSEWHLMCERLTTVAGLPVIAMGAGAITWLTVCIIWWVQTQRLSDSLAAQAHYDAQPPVKTNSHAPGGHPNNMV